MSPNGHELLLALIFVAAAMIHLILHPFRGACRRFQGSLRRFVKYPIISFTASRLVELLSERAP